MKFLLDHDVPEPVLVPALRALGHEVVLVRQVLDATAADALILDHAIATGAILLTCNRDDFLALAARREHAGIVILMRRGNRPAERNAVLRLIDSAGEAGLRGNINFA